MVSFDYVSATGSAEAYQALSDRLPGSNGSVDPRHFSAVAEGPAADCRLALRATRDAFAGDASAHGGLDDLVASLRGALLAANALLLGRGSPGVSLLAAAADPSGELVVAYCGDCHALLWRHSEASLERLTKEEYRHHLLGPLANPPIGQEYRALRDGDRVILCSGSLFDALTESQIEECCQLHEHEDAPRLAGALHEAIRAAEEGVRPALLVLGAEPMAAPQPTPPPLETRPEPPPSRPTTNGASSPIVSTLAATSKISPFFRPRLSPPASPGAGATADSPPAWPAPAGARDFPVASLPSLGKRLALLGSTAIVAVAVLFGAAVLGRRALANGIMVIPQASIAGELPPAGANGAPPDLFQGRTTQTTSPAPFEVTRPTDVPADAGIANGAQIQQRIDLLAPRAEAGDIASLQEIVALLEQRQLLVPGDPQVDEQLRVARANLAFRQRLQEVAIYWADGQTNAETTGSWGRTVEILEALQRLGLPPNHAGTVREKLYAAHVNYGKALEAARRPHEAAGQYQRAREIDPVRPEAPQALARLLR